jgi:hypothetical protein
MWSSAAGSWIDIPSVTKPAKGSQFTPEPVFYRGHLQTKETVKKGRDMGGLPGPPALPTAKVPSFLRPFDIGSVIAFFPRNKAAPPGQRIVTARSRPTKTDSSGF